MAESDGTNGNGALHASNSEDLIRPLTPRELDVLRLVSAGKMGRETAVILGVGHHTVVKHLSSIRLKLQARTTPHAVTIAMERGILTPTTP